MAEALKTLSHSWFRAVPGLSQHCHLLGPSRQTGPSRAVCVTHGACSEIPCPHRSQEQGGQGGGTQLLLIQNTPCANTRLAEESVEPLEAVYCHYCHSTAQRSQPTPGPSSQGDPHKLFGQGLAEEAAANLLPTFLLDR